MNKVFNAHCRALCLGALILGSLPLHMTAQSAPPVVNGRVGPDGKIQVSGGAPGTPYHGAPTLSPAGQKAEAQFMLAAKRQRQNRATEALAAYQEFIRQVKAGALAPGAMLPAYKNMEIIYRQRDDVKGMETTLDQIVALSPDPAALADLAGIEATGRRFAAAGAHAARALQLKPPPAVAAAAHFVLGGVAFDKHDYARGENELTTSIRLNPNNPAAHYYYGLILFQQGKLRPALVEAQKARQLAPAMTQASLLIAAIKNHVQDSSGAVSTYNDVLKVDPHNAAALFNRAVLIQKTGKIDAAIAAYTQLVSVYPQNFDGQLALGALYYQKRYYSQAIQHFAVAHSLIETRDPHDNRALTGEALAETLLASAMPNLSERARIGKQAEAHYLQAIARDPKDPKLPFQLAELYRRVGRYDDAIAIYRKRMAAAPDEPDSYFGIADVSMMRLRIADAIEIWKAYRKRKPNDPLSYERVAALLEMQGRWSDAVSENTHLVARDALDGNAHLALAKDYEQLQQPDKAEAEYKVVLGYDPTAKDRPINERPAGISDRQAWRLIAWRGLAKIEEERGHIEDAISYLDRVKLEEAAQAKKDERQPKPQVYVDIAHLYARDKRPDMAIKELTALTEVAPDDPTGFAELGAQYDAMGNADGAVAALRKASQRSKDPIDYVLKAADVYRRRGDLDKTIAEYERLEPKFPHDARLLSPMAQTLELRGKDDRALKIYAALLQADPTLRWVEERQANIMTRLKRYDDARALREKQIARNPNDMQGYADLSRIYAAQGKSEDYIAWLKTRADKKPGQTVVLSALIDEYTRQPKADAGWAYLRDFTNRHQNDLGVLDAYAKALDRHGRTSDAADVRGRIAALNPKNIPAQEDYIDSLFASGRKDEAAKVLQTQIARTDLTVQDRIELRQMWAQQLEQEGNTKDAIVQYQEIATAQPQNIEAVSALIRLLRASGNRDALIAACADLLKQPGRPSILRTQLLDTMGLAYEQQNKPDAARVEYTQALQIDPQDKPAKEGLTRIGTK